MCQAVGVGEGVGQTEGHRLWCGTADSKAVNCDGGKIEKTVFQQGIK